MLKRRCKFFAVGLLALVPIIQSFYIVLHYGVNVPYWDEWEIVKLYRDFL